MDHMSTLAGNKFQLPRSHSEEPSPGESFKYPSVIVLRSLELSLWDVRWFYSVEVPGN
jgi:hypothetical protein